MGSDLIPRTNFSGQTAAGLLAKRVHVYGKVGAVCTNAIHTTQTSSGQRTTAKVCQQNGPQGQR